MPSPHTEPRTPHAAGRRLPLVLVAALLPVLPFSPAGRGRGTPAAPRSEPQEKKSGPALEENVTRIKKAVNAEHERLEALYKHLHSHPELSLQEVNTAARMAREMRAAGFEVTEKVGGTGIVGVLRNGKGPTVMVRTDMDALPVVEQTGLPYASKVRARDRNDREVGVMHACGHDMHMK